MSVFEFNGMFMAIFITIVGFIVGMITIAVKISSLLNEIKFTNTINSQIIEKILKRLDEYEDALRNQQFNCLRYHPQAMKDYQVLLKGSDDHKDAP